MNPVVLFLVVVLALCVGVAWVWWRVLKRAAHATADASEGDRVGSNVAVYREQLAELERDRQQDCSPNSSTPRCETNSADACWKMPIVLQTPETG